MTLNERYYDGVLEKPELDELYHFGVKGMKWGVRKAVETVGSGARKLGSAAKKTGSRAIGYVKSKKRSKRSSSPIVTLAQGPSKTGLGTLARGNISAASKLLTPARQKSKVSRAFYDISSKSKSKVRKITNSFKSEKAVGKTKTTLRSLSRKSQSFDFSTGKMKNFYGSEKALGSLTTSYGKKKKDLFDRIFEADQKMARKKAERKLNRAITGQVAYTDYLLKKNAKRLGM